MIESRKDAMYLIGIHMVPNLVGIVRFSYGFHRTGAPVDGFLFDTTLGVECVLNVISDALVILLLWKTAAVSRLLGVFVMWNTVALLFCCGANLAGLRYPPKWYTGQNAETITIRKQMTVVTFWAPWIILSAHWKLYYTSLLYEFYKLYAATNGKAFDEENLVHVTTGDDAMGAGPSSLPPMYPAPPASWPRPVIASAPPPIFMDPTPIIGLSPAFGVSPYALSPGMPWPPALTAGPHGQPPNPSGPSRRPDPTSTGAVVAYSAAPVCSACPGDLKAPRPRPPKSGGRKKQ